MLSGGIFEPFQIHSHPGMVRKLERSQLQRFQCLQHLVTAWTLDTYDIAGLCQDRLARRHFRLAKDSEELFAVLHATGSSELPADDLATIKEHTSAPVILIASGESSTLLDEALSHVRSGRSQRFVIVAPPGVGKTRLLEELVRRSAGQASRGVATWAV